MLKRWKRLIIVVLLLFTLSFVWDGNRALMRAATTLYNATIYVGEFAIAVAGTYLGLTDTPSDFTGDSKKVEMVKTSEDALEHGTFDTNDFNVSDTYNITLKNHTEKCTFDVGSIIPNATNGCGPVSQREGSTSGLNIIYSAFSQSATKYGTFNWDLPDNYNGSLKAKVKWTSLSSSGSVRWYIRAACTTNDSPLDSGFSWGTAVYQDDVITAAKDSMLTPEFSITPSGTCTGGNKELFMEIYADSSNTTCDPDLRGIKIEYAIQGSE